MNITINQLPAASTIDPVADLLPIYTASGAATQAINRNTLLGLASAPVGLNDVQTLTNKVIGNTNSLTIKDGSLTIQNTADTTKRAAFSLASITTGTTRTYTLPNFNATLASLAGTETLTNKTLTSPIINSPTLTNASISADTITGYTVSNTGTIFGISVTTGTVGSAALATGSVTSTQIAANAVLTVGINDAAVTPAKLFAGTGTTWPSGTWSPSTANLTLNNGTQTAVYKQVGKWVSGYYKFALGSTSAVGTAPTISLPVAAHARYASNDMIGWGMTITAGQWLCLCLIVDSNTVRPMSIGAGAANVGGISTYTPSQPNLSSWSAGDSIQFEFFYEAA